MAWSFYDQNGKVLQGVLAVSIGATELATDAVTSVKIADDAVTYAKLQNLATADRVLGSASTGVIGEVQIVPDMLATDAVTTVKIAALQVTGAKIAANTITGDKIALGSDAAGDIMYYNGTDYIRLAKPGTPAGEALTFVASASAPSWVAASAGVGIGMVLALGG